jgi:hypothetical protein
MGQLTAGTASAAPSSLPNRPLDAFVYQGYLTDSGGTPLTGIYSITFRLYRAATTITLPPSTIYTLVATKAVTGIPVTKGLFTASIEGFGSYFTGEYQLSLGIQVGTDPEMEPYQEIASAPTALGLHPGTVITNTANDEPGLEVHSLGEGTSGAAVIATSDRYAAAGGGTGLYAESQGTSATIVTKNNGGGLLLEGYGADGGGDEFRITNNGTIQTKQDSYITVPGTAMQRRLSSDATRWDFQGGSVAIHGGNAGARTVCFPVTLPTVLYGQPVEVKSITVYYQTTNGSNAAIWNTHLSKSTAAWVREDMISDFTHRTSTTATSYTLPVGSGGVLSSNQGLVVNFYLYFANDTDTLYIGSIRIQLGHHPDY